MKEKIILDVRSDDEFQLEHIEWSIDIPLSKIERSAERIAKLLEWKKVLIMCRSGRRSELAYDILKKYLSDKDIEVYKGGIVKYKTKFPEQVHSHNKKLFIPLMRQVQVVAGGLILLWVILSLVFHTGFIFISGFVWAWLLFAWLTWFCGMARMLKLLPFNK